MAVAQHALTLRLKGEGHAVIKCAAGVGMFVCLFFSICLFTYCFKSTLRGTCGLS